MGKAVDIPFNDKKMTNASFPASAGDAGPFPDESGLSIVQRLLTDMWTAADCDTDKSTEPLQEADTRAIKSLDDLYGLWCLWSGDNRDV